jgi:hypothetical protein
MADLTAVLTAALYTCMIIFVQIRESLFLNRSAKQNETLKGVFITQSAQADLTPDPFNRLRTASTESEPTCQFTLS